MEPVTIDHLTKLWMEDRVAHGYRMRGLEKYRLQIAQYLRWAGPILPTAITLAHIRSYKRHLMANMGAGAARNALTCLRSFCTWLQTEGYLTNNPALLVPHPKVLVPDPDPLTGEQLQTLLAALDTPHGSKPGLQARNRRAVCLMVYAGLRIAEVTGLERRDLDLDRRNLRVRAEVGKGGKGRIVPICAELLVELDLVRNYEPTWAVVDKGDRQAGVHLGVKSLAHLFERALTKELGFPIHAHQLRKTFATELYERGEDLITIQRLLGHADPKTTMRYIGVSGRKEREAVEKLTFR